MIEFIQENNVLQEILFDKEDLTVNIPDNITEIKCCKAKERDWYASTHAYDLYIPDSVTRYHKKCFEKTWVKSIDLPYRKNLELGVTFHMGVDYMTLRLEDGTKLKFDFSKIVQNPVGLALQVYRTEEMLVKCSVNIKGPIAVYFAFTKDHQEAFEYVKENASKIGKNFIDTDDFVGMERLLALEAASKVPIDTMLKYAQSKEKKEFAVMLMQYKHEHFKEQKPNDRFRL